MPFKDLSEVLFLSYEENTISDEELLLLYDEYSSKNPEFEPLVSIWELAEFSDWNVLKSLTTTQERLEMRSGCHAAKIFPVGVRGTKNVWCLSSLRTRFNENSQLISLEKTLTFTLTISDFFVFWKSMLHPCLLRLRKKTYAGLLAAFKRAILTLWLWRAFKKILNWFHWRKR